LRPELLGEPRSKQCVGQRLDTLGKQTENRGGFENDNGFVGHTRFRVGKDRLEAEDFILPDVRSVFGCGARCNRSIGDTF